MATLILSTDKWDIWESKINSLITEVNNIDYSDMNVPFQVNGDESTPLVSTNYGEIRFTPDYNSTTYATIKGITGADVLLNEMSIEFEIMDGGLSSTALIMDYNFNILYGTSSTLMSSGSYNIAKGIADLTGNNNHIFSGYDTETIGDYNFAGTVGDVIITGNKNTTFGENSSITGDYNVVGGGNSHTITSHYNNVGGGHNNTIDLNSYAVISGGQNNALNGSGGGFHFIGGGLANVMTGGDEWNVIVGGEGNTMNTCDQSFIGGGSTNAITESNSIVVGGSSNAINGYNSVVVGGSTNVASGQSNFVGGGLSHTVGNSNFLNHISNGIFATIVAGNNNSAWADYSSIVGGLNNYIGASSGDNGIFPNKGSYGFVGGGEANKVFEQHGAVCGGYTNAVDGTYCFVGGGNTNSTSNTSSNSSIVGGTLNTLSNIKSIICGGASNDATGINSAILCGEFGEASGYRGTIVNGFNATASGDESLIGNGGNNDAQGDQSTILNGTDNTTYSTYSLISEGNNNTTGSALNINHATSGRYATILNGSNNTVSREYSSVINGSNNTISDERSIILNGVSNLIDDSGAYSVILNGTSHEITGSRNTILGGIENESHGNDNLVWGTKAKATTNGSVVISDSSDYDYSNAADLSHAWTDNSFNARFTGGFYLASGIDTVTNLGDADFGVQLLSDTNAWATLSDKNKKGNFTKVDHSETLNKLREMSVDFWQYKADITKGNDRWYYGFMAQDFHEAFDFGEDVDKLLIDTLQYEGVLSSAIKGLIERTDKQSKIIEKLQKRLDLLEKS